MLVAAYKAGAGAGLAGGAGPGLQGRLPLMPSNMLNTPSTGNQPGGSQGYQVRLLGVHGCYHMVHSYRS
jgi:hypothetical protein